MSMMAAYPPGMQQGGGLPHGHPGMGPGAHGPNPGGQPMGQGMQMHPGASGPGVVHVSQASPMMGMQPGMGGAGVGPGGPHQQMHPQMQLLQQQQQHQAHLQQAMANNPQYAAMQQQQQQQRAAQQQQQQQLLLQQQQRMMAQHQGMAQGGQNPNVIAQQMAAMQQNPGLAGVNLPAHLRHQITTQQQLQQMQQLQMQRIAMQQQASQEGHASQQAPQVQPTQQGPQVPVRPPSQMAGRPGQPVPPQGQQQPAQQQQQPQQPQPQPQPQQQQPAVTQAEQQQAQAVQAAQAAQTQQPHQQAQQNQQQGPGTPQQTGQPQNQQQQNQAQQAQNAQQQQGSQNPQQSLQQLQQNQMRMRALAMAQQSQQAQQSQKSNTGMSLMRLMLFADSLSKQSSSKAGDNDLTQWQNFVSRYFAEDGVFRHLVLVPGGKNKQFEIHAHSLPRYFFLNFSSGVENMQITLESNMEKEIPNGTHQVVSERAKLIYTFVNGSQMVSSGRLNAVFDGDKLELLEFATSENKQFIPLETLTRMREQNSQGVSPNMRSAKQSPKMQKKLNPRQPAIDEDLIPFSKIPSAPVNDHGVTYPVMRYYEFGEIMTYMRDLFDYSVQHPDVPPNIALERLVSTYENQPGAPNQPQQMPNNMPPGAAVSFPGSVQPGSQGTPQMQSTPQMGNQPMPGQMTPQQQAALAAQQGGSQFSSPAGGPHMNLPPGHPMGMNMPNGSPAMQHMMGTPQMAPGGMGGSVNSSPAMPGVMQPPGAMAMGVGSAGASPSMSNKRRRSAVKLEDGSTNGDLKVKESPRVGGKRQKGAPG